MQDDLIRIGLAFLEGFALIISPCILPILPIVLSGSLTGSKARPFGIISGFILTFTAFTLFSRYIIQLLQINPDTLRNASFIILILLGIVMVSSYLTDKFNILTNRFMNVGTSLRPANDTQGGFFSGLLFGCLIGIIWTPCAGPILAAVIIQVVTLKSNLSSLLTVIAFAIGAGVPMLLIAFAGREILYKFNFFRKHTVFIRKLLGLIIIASVITIIYLPPDIFSYSPNKSNNNQSGSLVNGLIMPYKAPGFAGITDWINSAPLMMEQLKGKVVLIDFWTYSCINCIRTLPYLKDWYHKYHDQGFVIVGVHSPEFLFEHDLNNVKKAVANNGITYPVALDNNFATWQNFHNRYWPAHYLINKDGDVVYEHFGEGEYDTTENNIRYLLNKPALSNTAQKENYHFGQTPETYLGYERAENFASPEGIKKNIVMLYTYPTALAKNEWALQGDWMITPEKIVSHSANAALKLHFNAAKVFLVMGRMNPGTINVRLDDVKKSDITISDHRLYSVLNLDKQTDGYLELIFPDSGTELYAFTFG